MTQIENTRLLFIRKMNHGQDDFIHCVKIIITLLIEYVHREVIDSCVDATISYLALFLVTFVR